MVDLRSVTDPAELGAMVRALRAEKGLPRSAVARAAGLSESTIKNVEKGTHRATGATRAAIARVLQPPT